MADQFSLGMLLRLIDDLTLRVEALEAQQDEEGEDEPAAYLDGTPIR